VTSATITGMTQVKKEEDGVSAENAASRQVE
jgi:hypothetical protein